MPRTRSVFKCPVLGVICELKYNVLPTYDDVIKLYEWTRHQRKLRLETAKEPVFAEIADIVTSTIENIWQTASIPTVTRTRIIQMLKAYHLKYKNLLKSVQRVSEDKLERFRHSGRLLFDISACKCKEFIKCTCPKDKKVPKQEQAFLIDQRTCRHMIIGGIDPIITKKLQSTLKRKHERENRQNVSSNTSTSSLAVLNVSTSSETSSMSDRSEFEEVTQKKRKKSSRIDFPTLSKTCDRYGVSDRAAAAIASSVLFDIDSDIGVIDRHKLRRQRTKTRNKLLNEVKISELNALYFDGRKDKTLKIVKKNGKCYRTLTVEEHISLIQEPGSIYLGYVVPNVGTAKGIEISIAEFLTREQILLHELIAIGCDGTNVNTGKNGGIIRLFERKLQKPLQWIVCLLHMNELPLRHLFLHLDGCTSGPKSFSGPLGKALETCEQLPIRKFQPIEGEMLPEMAKDLSTDQQYLHNIVTAVLTDYEYILFAPLVQPTGHILKYFSTTSTQYFTLSDPKSSALDIVLCIVSHLQDDREFWTPLDYFSHYFSDEFWENLSKQSNIKAMQANEKKLLNSTEEEYRKLAGIHILMGIFGLPRLRLDFIKGIEIPIITQLPRD
ncbi:unnamed protein product [Acanthoscelides obtectus]|uniref:PiggyBac transposable element-derived protein domain-containing protein n=1 Tax=Acanthoscelides obtectus TaxID=200917 RepID=A0A9P0P4A1_ACAOB|nr:unnamed protein product [Acanthoscelides obtectus]CAK1631068.1 hypothetical protein AOBTE_LOCUS6739 [Acanthoscelides obtectus]